MYATEDRQLTVFLDRIVSHIQRLQRLDLSDEGGVEQALVESRQVMGALAMYRHQLHNADAHPTYPLRKAA